MAIARVIVGSLVAHAALLAVLDAYVDGAPPRLSANAPPTIELIEPVRSTDPIEVAILAPDPVPMPMPAAQPARSTKRVAVASIVETAAPSIVETPSSSGETPVGPEAPVGPNRWTRMRGPEGPRGPDLRIHDDVPHEVAPAETAPKSDKKLQQDGTAYVVPDLVTTMHVAPDGRASFVDKPDIEIHLTLPKLPSKKSIGNHLAGWYRDPYAQKNARRYQDMPRHEQAVEGGWDAGAGGDTNIDGSIQGPERMPGVTDGTLPVLGGKADITAWLMRKVGIGDPYASRKRVLLDGTHAERAQIRARYTREQLDHSASIMQKNVARVWYQIHDPAQRRAALFALWDECAEGEGADGEAGQRARSIVIGAIRGRLSGGPDRFTVEEIAALDAKRTSTQHFVPYD